MKAKESATCWYDLCAHGGRIRVGEEITWNRKVAGSRYHVDCFVKVKGLEEYNPTQRETVPVKVAVFDEEIWAETEVDVEVTQTKEDGELRHYLYELLKHYVEQRQHVYLWSAPGSGKSHVARQIAKELGLAFSYVSVNPQSPASLLLGYMDAHGIYRESELFRMWRDGGVFLFDEQDNCSSSLLTILNGMLASDLASFPCGMTPRHKDFIFIGTGNTTGRGGDWQYPERRKIDEASISRLVFLKWDYDKALEMGLALRVNANATRWVEWIQCVRAYCFNKGNGVKGGIYADPRAAVSGAKDLLKLGKPFFTIAEIAERNVFKGADADIVARIVANCPFPRI